MTTTAGTEVAEGRTFAWAGVEQEFTFYEREGELK
jgi:hypothetical protein